MHIINGKIFLNEKQKWANSMPTRIIAILLLYNNKSNRLCFYPILNERKLTKPERCDQIFDWNGINYKYIDNSCIEIELLDIDQVFFSTIFQEQND